MTKFLYFDSNIYDHIYKRNNFSDDDFLILIAAIKSNRISILLSSIVIEEIITLLNSDPIMSIEQLRLVFNLVNPDRIIKAHSDLINDNILSFARKGMSCGSFILNPDYIYRFKILLAPTQEDINKLVKEINLPTKKEKEEFLEFQKEIKSKIIPNIKQIKNQHPQFSDLYNILAEPLVENLAEQSGVLEQCRSRGIENYLI